MKRRWFDVDRTAVAAGALVAASRISQSEFDAIVNSPIETGP